MSATIHYLRPFQRENLAETAGEAEAEEACAHEDEEPKPAEKRARGRAMPCGRKSGFKKRMDGKVVPRDKR